jgi:hypothetical protein
VEAVTKFVEFDCPALYAECTPAVSGRNGPVTGTILNAEYDQCAEDSAPIKRRQMFAKMGALSDYSKWAEEEGRYHRESFTLISPFIISTQYKADASPPSHFKLPHLLFPQRIMSPASSLFAVAFLLAVRVVDAQAQSLVYPGCPSSWSWVSRSPFTVPIIDAESA